MSPAASIRPLIAGNWKMNGLRGQIGEAMKVAEAISGLSGTRAGDVMICPPATLVMALAEMAKATRLQVGAQDCHALGSGAHTGDLSAEMLKDAGACAVIVGHSERRSDHGETSADVRVKTEAVYRAGLSAIVCIGETAGERRAGLTLTVVGRQLEASLPKSSDARNTVIAYEPVWAIGTGLTPTIAEVADVHQAIRAALVARFGSEGGSMRILYGGSVKPDNARELLAVPNVNGALVGGASLKAADFLGIVRAYSD